jgi:hypothetical protein
MLVYSTDQAGPNSQFYSNGSSSGSSSSSHQGYTEQPTRLSKGVQSVT